MRLVETRTQSSVTKPGKLRQRPQYYDRLWSHRPYSDEWSDLDWEGIRSASVKSADCDACVGRGRRRCPSCMGHASVGCPKAERCGKCRGAGRVETILGMETCEVCDGRKRVGCARCKGTGRRVCSYPSCTGGQVRCERCQGHGLLTTYDVGRIHRRVDRTVVDAGVKKVTFQPKDTDGYQTVATDEEPDLSSLPTELRRQLQRELARSVENETRRKVRRSILPVIEVGYQYEGSPGVAWLVGPGHRVHAPEARWLGFGPIKLRW